MFKIGILRGSMNLQIGKVVLWQKTIRLLKLILFESICFDIEIDGSEIWIKRKYVVEGVDSRRPTNKY